MTPTPIDPPKRGRPPGTRAPAPCDPERHTAIKVMRDRGATPTEIAKALRVSRATVRKHIERWLTAGA